MTGMRCMLFCCYITNNEKSFGEKKKRINSRFRLDVILISINSGYYKKNIVFGQQIERKLFSMIGLLYNKSNELAENFLSHIN